MLTEKRLNQLKKTYRAGVHAALLFSQVLDTLLGLQD
jgi:hypothetical protein